MIIGKAIITATTVDNNYSTVCSVTVYDVNASTKSISASNTKNSTIIVNNHTYVSHSSNTFLFMQRTYKELS